MKIEWREYPFDAGVMVSNTGRVISYKSGKQHELSPSDNGRGYMTVSLGLRNPKYIHRLVAETFLPNPNGLPEVNHIDGNKKNNNVYNLEWCTTSDNKRHACVTGLNISQKPIRVVETGEVFISQNECARRIGGTASGIHDCRSGRHSSHRGYHFEFQNDNGEWFKTERELKVNKKMVQVVETGRIYNSMTECAKDIGGTVSGIISCEIGRQKSHRGYHFYFPEGGGYNE